MQMTVNVAGQVRQIKLGQNKALWPLFETVINSIQSLEDTDTAEKRIIIEALRNPNVQLRVNKDGSQAEEQSHFEQFIVTDNGNGFNEANFKSFNEAYSLQKIEKGCNGVLKKKNLDDCQHISAAILSNCDIIISWNFKHIVNVKTIRGIKVITTVEGYKDLLIYPPSALLSEEE